MLAMWIQNFRTGPTQRHRFFFFLSIYAEILLAVIKLDEAVQGKITEREKQRTKDGCLRSIAIFGKAIFSVIQEDRMPIKPYQIRNH